MVSRTRLAAATGLAIFEGEKCALAGVQPITGSFALLAPTGQTENISRDPQPGGPGRET